MIGKPGMLQFMRSQRVGHNLVIEQQSVRKRVFLSKYKVIFSFQGQFDNNQSMFLRSSVFY